jgi:23S rRNA (guanosine2251-2'-O)-methyltransferase
MKKLSMQELNRLTIDEFKALDKIPVIVVLEDIRSAMNVGSIFRTSDAFSISKIILCGITATPPNKEIFKTALGSTDSVDWEYYEDITEVLSILKENSFNILGIEQTDNSTMLSDLKLEMNEKYAIIVGNEVDGVSDATLKSCNGIVEIPQWGTKHSLNVSVCTGIVIWELTKFFKVIE